MAVFSGNPADRATGNVAPGSLREAAGSSLSNGTARNNNFGGTLGRDLGDRGLRANRDGLGAGSMKDQSRIGSDTVVRSTKGSYLGGVGDRQAMASAAAMSTGPVPRNTPKASTGPVSRGVMAKAPTSAPMMKTGLQDYKSIVPGKVTMTAEKVPFAQKNPNLAKYMGGTPAKPVKVTVAEAKKMAGTVAKTGAYVSSANWFAEQGLPKSALTKVGTKTSGYGTTTVQAGPAMVGLSYPKSVATGKSFGTYTAGSKSSTGPVSRGTQPKSSTGPVSRGISPTPQSTKYYDVNYKRDVAEAFRKPSTVTEVRVESKQKKSAAATPRVVKDGYVYTRVGNKLQNFGAASSSKGNNRTRRKEK
jgi:hypothetical protein